MKRIFIGIFLGFILALIPTKSLGQWVDAERQELAIRNLLQNSNPGFENGLATWVASGGSTAKVTSGSNLLDDKASMTWDASASGDWIRSQLVTIPNGLKGRNGLARIKTMVPSGTATTLIQVYDGTNVIAQASMASTTTPSFQDVNFIFPSSGSIAIRAYAQANEPLTVFDSAFIGDAVNYLNVAQASFFGAANWIAVANCTWDVSSTSFSNYSADTDCTTPTGSNLEGFASAPGTKIPAIVFSSMGPGRYYIVATGIFLKAGTTSSSRACWRFSDGTNTSQSSCVQPSATTTQAGTGSVIGELNYTTSQSNVTIQLQGLTDGAAESAQIVNNSNATTNTGLKISVYKFPSSTQLAQKPDAINWRVDANISGANPSLGTSTVSSYTEITDTGLTLTQNTGSDTTQIACASGTASTGTTCSSAESVGIAFNIPWAGSYRACTGFTHRISLGAGGSVDAYFQIVETTNTSSGVTQTGKTRFGSSLTVASTGQNKPIFFCSDFYFSSAGQKTLRLEYTQTTGATVSLDDLLIDGSSGAAGDRDLHWIVTPLNGQAQAAPIVNSVTSSYSGSTRIERYKIGTTTSCTISSTSDTGASGANAGTGRCAITFGTPFSSAPTCTPVVNYTGTGVFTAIIDTSTAAPTTTTVNIGSINAGAYSTSDGFHMICMGPR